MQQNSAKPRRRTAKSGSKQRRAKGIAGPRKPKKQQPVLSYRDRKPEDDAFILQLTEGQLASVHEQAFGEPFPRDQFMRYVQSGAPVTVVELGKKPIGYYTYLIGQDGKMHISAMVIDRKYQSKGIGSSVMARLEKEAQAQGVHTLEVFVQGNNERSIGFTKQLGFVEVYRVPPNTICFQKRIASTETVPAGRM